MDSISLSTQHLSIDPSSQRTTPHVQPSSRPTNYDSSAHTSHNPHTLSVHSSNTCYHPTHPTSSLPLPGCLSSGGNQRETDRARAAARAGKHASKEKLTQGELLKKKESDAEAMRRKQAAADAKRQAGGGAAATGGGKEEKEEKKK